MGIISNGWVHWNVDFSNILAQLFETILVKLLDKDYAEISSFSWGSCDLPICSMQWFPITKQATKELWPSSQRFYWIN